jgi:hypothetical protein
LAKKRAIAVANAAVANGDDDKSLSEYKRETPQDHANRRWYFREMNKVIDAADVIIEVIIVIIINTYYHHRHRHKHINE